MIKTVLLDFDGVISDSLDQVMSSWQFNATKFGNGKTLTKEFVRSCHNGAWKVFYAEKLGIPKEKFDETSRIFLERATKHGVNPIYDGIKNVIENLSKDFPMYVLSSNFEKTIKRDLDHYDLTKYFKGIAGHEHARGLDKSSKEFLLNFLEEWDLKPEDVVYVGDTSDEVRCGKMAGIKTIGCVWGYQSQHLIEEAGPDAVAKEPKDLLTIINNLR